MQNDKPVDLIFTKQIETFNKTEFYGDVIAKLAQNIEETVGLHDAEGYISNVGELLGEQISKIYDNTGAVSNNYIGQILVDLKQRIGGEFKVHEVTKDKIVLTNTRCPFGDKVHGNKSLCMMTTNVFGKVTSDRNGFAHVVVEDAIADNKTHCKVVVSLSPEAVNTDDGVEFFGD